MPQTYIRAVAPGEVGRTCPVAVSWSRNGRGVPGMVGTSTDDQVCILASLGATAECGLARWDHAGELLRTDRSSINDPRGTVRSRRVTAPGRRSRPRRRG